MENYQKEIFRSIEGDQWFNRNKSVQDVYEIYRALTRFLDKNSKVLEIGCSAGKNLNYFQKEIGCECYGIDPSSKAIEEGKENFPDLNLSTGTADELHFNDEFFDFVLFGFCMCLVDRKLLSRTVAEADRVTKDKGFLGIIDFDPGLPIKKDFIHYEGLKTYKYDYSKLFLSFPHYTMADKSSYSHNTLAVKNSASHFTVDNNIDERVSSVILYKDHSNCYFSL
ncbi:class I SAM-dependent methyltransferase [Cytobacillus firmus]|uniref:class I SAM-dependent methyltransferase n=1 Tax=Cytobacillus firmus TaxID=1399 RepID=UPI00216128C3|nr:class I SAM-dependent methyltransferase [Cytobacillus firmus]MCS0674062.1 class I SAM-dependent methyltransferase [Cytobacillus firmus]